MIVGSAVRFTLPGAGVVDGQERAEPGLVQAVDEAAHPAGHLLVWSAYAMQMQTRSVNGWHGEGFGQGSRGT